MIFSLFDMASPPKARTAASLAAAQDPPPIRPKLSLKDDGSVVVDMGFVHRWTVRHSLDGGIEEGEVLYACLKAGVERDFGTEEAPLNPFVGTDRRSHRKQMRSIVREIQEECLREFSEAERDDGPLVAR